MRSGVRLLPFLLLAACAQPLETSQRSQACTGSSGGHDNAADVHLDDAHGTGVQVDGPLWQLSKTGSVDAASSTVSWTITATQVGTVSGRLLVDGVVEVRNTGDLPATIGNVAVLLERGPHATPVSADVADATAGDAATSIAVDPHVAPGHVSTISENAASGSLVLLDASNDAPIALVPELQLDGHSTRRVLFSAAFDNNVLGLAVGELVRAQAFVSYGNANPHGSSAANVDINGNGAIDADEMWVNGDAKTVAFRVPAPTTTSSSPTIADDAAAITTTGTVTITSSSFALGATSGTASATFDAGAHGGTITNCAQLTGAGTTTTFDGYTFPNGDGVSATACDTETVPPPCVHGTTGCPWQNGDETSYTQVSWPDNPTASALLAANYGSVYAAVSDVFVIGTGGFSLSFGDATHLLAFLPQAGTPGPLTESQTNPGSSEAGLFGGDVAALKLDVDFSDAGLLANTVGVSFGDLHLCSLVDTPDLNGSTVRQLLDIANGWLGGNTGPDTLAAVDTLVENVNIAFDGGTVTPFAQAHLVNGTCP